MMMIKLQNAGRCSDCGCYILAKYKLLIKMILLFMGLKMTNRPTNSIRISHGVGQSRSTNLHKVCTAKFAKNKEIE
jgi:hypothetical protein